MRPLALLLTAATLMAAASAQAADCRLTPKQVVTKFMTEF